MKKPTPNLHAALHDIAKNPKESLDIFDMNWLINEGYATHSRTGWVLTEQGKCYLRENMDGELIVVKSIR